MSRVINGNDCVADCTRARILEVIRRLKYVPHYGAHSLVTRRNNLVGVLLHLCAEAPHGEMEPVRPVLVIRNSCGRRPDSALVSA